MIPIKTTALIATMSLLGAITPAAFAQDFDFSASNTIGDFTVDQSQTTDATATSEEGDSSVEVNNEQGFCINVAQASATTGSTADALAAQFAGRDIDCS
jgi:hypothetical protein